MTMRNFGHFGPLKKCIFWVYFLYAERQKYKNTIMSSSRSLSEYLKKNHFHQNLIPEIMGVPSWDNNNGGFEVFKWAKMAEIRGRPRTVGVLIVETSRR